MGRFRCDWSGERGLGRRVWMWCCDWSGGYEGQVEWCENLRL